MKRKFSRPLALSAAALLLLVMLVGGTIGRYVTTSSVTGEMELVASLATAVNLWEYQALPEADGSYTLNTTTVKSNSYKLIPGVDLPKDPYVEILGKTHIPAYLYLIVDNQLDEDSGITFSLRDCWKPLGTEFPNVYVYSEPKVDGVPIQITNTTTNLAQIFILEKNEAGNTIMVSQNLDRTIEDVELSFSAVLKEISKNEAQDKTALEVYRNQPEQP